MSVYPSATTAPRQQIRRLARPRLPAVLRRAGLAALVLSPTLLAGVYYGAIATDQYVSEARFVIRNASKPALAGGGIGALLQMVGLSRSQDDAWAVHDFLTSRDALRALEQRVQVRAIYADPRADRLARYPSVLFGATEEEFYHYFQTMLRVSINSTSGLTILRVNAFDGAQAEKLAASLLDLGEEMVNRLNQRSEADAVRLAQSEVARAEQRRIASAQALTAFRDRELLLDPDKNAAIVLQVTGKLATQLAQSQATLAEMRASAPGNPNLPTLTREIAALQAQIQTERDRIGADGEGLAEKLAQYERLMLEQEFSTRALSTAVAALDQARLEARRQQLFLERVVEPGRADYPIKPDRLAMVMTIFGFNLIFPLLVWLIINGIREHGSNEPGS